MTDEPILHLTRDISVPRSVSPEAQALIAAGQAIVAQRLGRPVQYPALDDGPGWKALIAALDESNARDLAARVAAVDATTEHTRVGDVDVYVVTPADADRSDDALVYCFMHGGSLIAGGGDLCRMLGTVAAARAGLRTWAVDYRMPPDHPYPVPLDDCLAVYRELLAVQRPERIVMAGRSAGGNLAAALLLRAHAEGLPMPACLVLETPMADLTESGETFETNQYVDYLMPTRLAAPIALYANGHDLHDPYISPLFGDVSMFPPTFLQTGTRDLFLSNTVRMHRALRAAGVEAELHVWDAMPHGGFPRAPEDDEVTQEMRTFLARYV